jgi:Tfp pilus assembly protein PilF
MAWDFLTRLYCRTGRASSIEGRLRERIQQHPSSLGLRTALIYTLIHQAKYDAAAAEAKKVLKADERNVRAMQLLAQVYFREGKNELAKMVLENARAIDPSEAATHNALGLVNLALKSRKSALENFKQAASLKPDFAEAKNNFGAMLNEAQDYESAVRELEGAVKAAPDFAVARLNLGNAYRGKQDFPKAIAEYKQVMQLSPNLPDTYFNMAILHLDSELPQMDNIERFKASIAYFDKYRELGGKDDRVEQYIKDATKGIEKEERRRERERRDALKKSEKEAAEKKKAQEDAEAASLAKKAEDEKAAADKKAAEQKAAEQAAAEKAKAAAEAEAKAKKAAPAQKAAPASKLGEDEAPTPAPKAGSGKLGEGEK